MTDGAFERRPVYSVRFFYKPANARPPTVLNELDPAGLKRRSKDVERRSVGLALPGFEFDDRGSIHPRLGG